MEHRPLEWDGAGEMKVLNHQQPISIRRKLLQFSKKWLSELRKARPPSPEVPVEEAAELEDTKK